MKRILPKRLPIPQSMDSPEREYLRNLLRYQSLFGKLVTAGVSQILQDLQSTARAIPDELRHDSVGHMDGKNIEKSIRQLLDQVRKTLMNQFPDKTLKKWAELMVGHVNQVQKKNMIRLGQAVDIEIEPLMTDKGLSPYFKNVVDENVGLIRSLSEDKLSEFKKLLIQSILKDKTSAHIAELVEKHCQVTQSKAKLLARDQVNKLNGSLNQYRQQKLGILKYTWETSQDERVRHDHALLQGKTFLWSKPPIVNRKTGMRAHPGQDFFCRCTARPDMSDVVD